MGRKNNALEETFDPLTEDQAERFVAAAMKSDDRLASLTARTLLRTGLRSDEFCHMRPSWLQDELTSSLALLDVPFTEECIGAIDTTEGTDEDRTSGHREPCQGCRNLRGGEWKPKSDEARRRLPIPIDIFEMLEEWFATHEHIPLLRNGAHRRVKDIAEQAGIEREVTPRNLRETYAAKRRREGHDLSMIQSLMGQNSHSPMLKHSSQAEFLSKWGKDNDESDDGQQSSGGDDGE
jgi:integrase